VNQKIKKILKFSERPDPVGLLQAANTC